MSPEQKEQIKCLMRKHMHNPNMNITRTLEKANDILNGFGIERIQKEHNKKSPAITYVNMGETYATTLLFYNGGFHIGSWGDIVERGSYD